MQSVVSQVGPAPKTASEARLGSPKHPSLSIISSQQSSPLQPEFFAMNLDDSDMSRQTSCEHEALDSGSVEAESRPFQDASWALPRESTAESLIKDTLASDVASEVMGSCRLRPSITVSSSPLPTLSLPQLGSPCSKMRGSSQSSADALANNGGGPAAAVYRDLAVADDSEADQQLRCSSPKPSAQKVANSLSTMFSRSDTAAVESPYIQRRSKSRKTLDEWGASILVSTFDAGDLFDDYKPNRHSVYSTMRVIPSDARPSGPPSGEDQTFCSCTNAETDNTWAWPTPSWGDVKAAVLSASSSWWPSHFLGPLTPCLCENDAGAGNLCRVAHPSYDENERN